MANQPKKYKKFVATAATATLVASAIVPVASAAPSDIANSEFNAEILEAIELGLFQDNDSFNPSGSLKRGHVVLIVGRYLKEQGYQAAEDYATNPAFSDLKVGANDEYLEMSSIVKEAGVFTGSNGEIKWNNNITREAIAAVLDRLAGEINGVSLVDAAADIEDKEVKDLDKAQAQYRDAIQAVRDLEISTANNYNPKGEVKRGQFAKLIVNALKTIEEIGGGQPTPPDLGEIEKEITAAVMALVTTEVTEENAKEVQAKLDAVNAKIAEAEALVAASETLTAEEKAALQTKLDGAKKMLAPVAEKVAGFLDEKPAPTIDTELAAVDTAVKALPAVADVATSDVAKVDAVLKAVEALEAAAKQEGVSTADAEKAAKKATDAKAAAKAVQEAIDALTKEPAPTTPDVVEVTSVSAINTNEVKVEFNSAVDTSKAVITLKKGAVVYNAEVTYSEDKKSAVLKTQINLPAGDYSVTVTGVAEEALTSTFKVEAEKVSAIEVVSNSVVAANDSTVNVNVLNQYGTVMSVNGDALTVTAFNATKNNNVTVTGVAGKKQIKFPTVSTGVAPSVVNEFVVGDDIRVTVTYQGVTVQKVVKAQAVSAAATIDLGDVSPLPNKARVTAGETGLSLPYELADQFGAELDFATRVADDSVVGYTDDNNTTIDGVLFTTSNASVVDPDTFAVDADGKLTFTAGAAGTAKITAIINATGKVATIDVTVNAASALKTLTLSEPSKLVAAGESVEIPFSALDQYDNVLKASDISGAVTWTSSNAAIIPNVNVTFDSKGKLNATTIGTAAGKVTLTATDASGKTLATVALDVQAAAEATSIVSIDAPTLLEAAATFDVDFADIKVKDQYGRDYKLEDGDVVTYVAKDGNADAVTDTYVDGNSNSDFDNVLDKVTFTGTTTTTSNEVFEFKLANGATFNFTLASVASDAITAYEIVDPGTVYANGSHAVTLDVVGKVSNGSKVALKAGKVTAFTSSTPSIATVSGTTLTGVKAGTTTVSAFEGATKLVERTVTVSDETPVPTTVKFANAEETVAVGGTLTVTPEIKDQYGVVVADSGVYTSSKPSVATVNSSGVITPVAAGTTVISYVTTNGLVATYELIVTP